MLQPRTFEHPLGPAIVRSPTDGPSDNPNHLQSFMQTLVDDLSRVGVIVENEQRSNSGSAFSSCAAISDGPRDTRQSLLSAGDVSEAVEKKSFCVDGLGTVTLRGGVFATPALQTLLSELLRVAVENATALQRVRDLERALDLGDTGVIVLGLSGELIFASHAAQRLIDAQDGLRRHRSGITATDVTDAVKFRTAINHVATAKVQNATTILPLNRNKAAQPIFAVISSGASDGCSGAVIIHLFVPYRDISCMLKPVCDLYRLSVAEYRLACALAEGLSTAEAAELIGIKEMTARGYLKQIFSKTGCSRQSELVRLLLTSVVKIADLSGSAADCPDLGVHKAIKRRGSDSASWGRPNFVNNPLSRSGEPTRPRPDHSSQLASKDLESITTRISP